MFRRRKRALLIAVVVSLVFSLSGIDGSLLGFTRAYAQPVSENVSDDRPGERDGILEAAPAGTPTEGEPEQHEVSETFQRVLVVLLVMLLLAKIGGDLFERINQPAVLGELIFGIVIGNLSLFGFDTLSSWVNGVIRHPETELFITMLAEIGVVLLLFEVGLESTVAEMLSVGASSLLVALLGVVAPMALGYGVGLIFLPEESWMAHLFLAAVLAATSVGITARVLRDVGKMHLRESKIILGAAVIDDILGLVVLAVVQGIIHAANAGTRLEAGDIILMIAKAVGFFMVAIALGALISRRMYKMATFLHVKGVLLTLTLVWCFLIAYLGSLFGLAPIVGAFAAGLVLEEATFIDWRGREMEMEHLLVPITTFLVPVFFVHMGMKVDLATFGQVEVLGFAAALTFAAIIGKQLCSLGVLEKKLNRLAVGVGMIPRGEVGLIVANIGLSLRTADGSPIISQYVFSATVIMVVITTMITPPLLKWLLERKPRIESVAES